MNPQLPRFVSAVAFLGITTGLLPPRLDAQHSAASVMRASVIRPGIPASDSELTAAVQARVARGDVLTGMRRFAAAQREYRGAAELARRQGHLPSFTLWHLASAYYYQGDHQRAAAVLEQLAAEAARCGDLAVEALALYNAAWLNGEGGRGRTAATQVADLTLLLRSPYMPAAVRDHLNGRLAPPSAVALER